MWLAVWGARVVVGASSVGRPQSDDAVSETFGIPGVVPFSASVLRLDRVKFSAELAGGSGGEVVPFEPTSGFISITGSGAEVV